MMKIYLQPIGEVNKWVLERLVPSIESAFYFPVEVLAAIPLPYNAFNRERRQYHSTKILNSLANCSPADAVRVVGVTEADLYVPQLNFVFGEAVMNGKVAIISFHRLYPEFYGLPQNEELLLSRAIKEAIHELGHTFGLRHCLNPKCVMYFSNSITDTDIKSEKFCRECGVKIREAIPTAA
ncbi:MAG: archaemetzincin family Zn-dependent metalloprotease [Armatimonadota bacterium]|nr:archaemetzincin family Zn-dependent metalloprotease [Armatimonadota bacterium]